MNPARLHRILITALLGILVLAIYWRVTGFNFCIIDDPAYAQDNPHISTGLSWNNFKWAWHARVAANWHPLTVLSHMLDCTLFGGQPGWHHLTNVLLHAANTMLLFWILLGLTAKLQTSNSNLQTSNVKPETLNLWMCALVAALFGLHPLRVESVAWISERKDVLSGFFFLLMLAAYLRFTECKAQGSKFKVRWYVLALLLFALGLMSKPMVVTAPCVLVLLDYWPLQRIQEFKWRPLMASVIEKAPFFALTAVFCVVTFLVQKKSGAVISLAEFPLRHRLANAAVSYARYVGKTFWPHSLAGFYPYHIWPASQVIPAILLFAAISIVAILSMRRRPYLFVGWFLFAGMLVPVIGISQVGMQAMADRFTYLPHIGLLMAVVWLAFDLGRKFKPSLLAISGALVAAACVPVTMAQLATWKDSETMITHTLRAGGDSSEAHFYLASVLQGKGKFDEAKFHYMEAYRINPLSHEALCGVGNVLNEQGKLDEAAEQYEKALKMRPDSPMAHHCLADLRMKQGRSDEAIAHYTAALQGNPDLPDAHFQLAGLLAAKHYAAGAMFHFHEAVRLHPNWTEALNNLAWDLATQREDTLRNGQQAEQFAMRAVTLTRNNDPAALDTLAAAFAEEGRFSDAVRTAASAMEKAKAAGDTNMAVDIQSRIKLYQSQRAYRE